MRVRLLGRLLDLNAGLTFGETADDREPIFVSFGVRVVRGLHAVDDFLQVVDGGLPIAAVDPLDHPRPAFVGDHGPTDAFERRAGCLGRSGREGSHPAPPGEQTSRGTLLHPHRTRVLPVVRVQTLCWSFLIFPIL